MRRSALANRERILAAAEAVFGADGARGSTEDVAELAGVGIATVFRHFPTKEQLVEATLVRHFHRLDEQAIQLAGDLDPDQALRELMATMIDTSATKLTLVSLVGERGEIPVREAAETLRATMDGILARAKAAGAVQHDVTVDELFVLVRGLAQAAATLPLAPGTLSGAIEIVYRGLRPVSLARSGAAASARESSP
jgi:AcrR family transcriptional regulator